MPPKASPQEMLNVARQLLQGHVYVRVRGDARQLLAAGQSLPMSVATVKAHVGRLFTKLDVDNRVQIAILVHDAQK